MQDHNTLTNLTGQTITVIISGKHTLAQAALRQGIAIEAGKYTMTVGQRSKRNVNLYQVSVGAFTFMAIIKADDWSDNYRLVTFYYGKNEAQVLEHKNNTYVYGLDTRAKNNDMLSIAELKEIHKEIQEELGHN